MQILSHFPIVTVFCFSPQCCESIYATLHRNIIIVVIAILRERLSLFIVRSSIVQREVATERNQFVVQLLNNLIKLTLFSIKETPKRTTCVLYRYVMLY